MFRIALFMQVHRKMEQLKDAKSATKKKRRKRSSIKAQTIFFLWFRQEAAFIKLVAVGSGHVAHKHVVTWHHMT